MKPIKNNLTQCQRWELVQSVVPMLHKFVNKVVKSQSYNKQQQRDDLFDICLDCTYKCSETYDKNIGKFTTYVFPSLKSAYNQFVNNSKRKEETNFDGFTKFRDDTNELPEESLIDTNKFYPLIENLDDKLRQIVEWKYRDGMTLKEISYRLEITRQRAQQLLAKALEKAKRGISSPDYYFY